MRCRYSRDSTLKLSSGIVHVFSFEEITSQQFRGLVMPWCIENYGEDPMDRRWWRYGHAVAMFDENDALAFRMRWGGQVDD
ncbi:MAG: hypothetical protein EOP84_20760 [Verrucomicrobiaceae bacterium]|nr:MAG: hypothetical protein EOP84_20760 [Verrucomicrobiaceae bacterium]